MRYIANKRCRINGRTYAKGEIISSSELPVYGAARLLKYNILTEVPEAAAAQGTAAESKAVTEEITVPVYGTDTVLSVSEAELVKALTVCQMPADEAAAEIEQVTEKAVYELLSLIETRQKTKTALKKIADKFSTSDVSGEAADNEGGGDE